MKRCRHCAQFTSCCDQITDQQSATSRHAKSCAAHSRARLAVVFRASLISRRFDDGRECRRGRVRAISATARTAIKLTDGLQSGRHAISVSATDGRRWCMVSLGHKTLETAARNHCTSPTHINLHLYCACSNEKTIDKFRLSCLEHSSVTPSRSPQS